MSARVRKAFPNDLVPVFRLYDSIHSAIESGQLVTGWLRNGYPVRRDLITAFKHGELFVLEFADMIAGAAVINHDQHESYASVHWHYSPDPAEIMVLHTLAIDPAHIGAGLGREFIRFYAQYALAQGSPYLRLDTNVCNQRARRFYNRLGFREAGIVSTSFAGLGSVDLVLMEHLAAALA